MWGLRLFSRSLFNTIAYVSSFNLKASGFSTPLAIVFSVTTINLIRFSRLYGRFLIYRVIVSIPFFYILFSILHYKLFCK
jgi:hypothetical protein